MISLYFLSEDFGQVETHLARSAQQREQVAVAALSDRRLESHLRLVFDRLAQQVHLDLTLNHVIVHDLDPVLAVSGGWVDRLGATEEKCAEDESMS